MVYSFAVGFGDINPTNHEECLYTSIVLIISCVMKAMILAQFASPIIDDEIVNYELYSRLRNEKLVRRERERERARAVRFLHYNLHVGA